MDVRPLSDDDQRLFFELLQRVCENHVDQWLRMRVDTSSGMSFFVDINLAPPAGDPDLYELRVTPNDRLGDHWQVGAAMDEERLRRQGGKSEAES